MIGIGLRSTCPNPDRLNGLSLHLSYNGGMQAVDPLKWREEGAGWECYLSVTSSLHHRRRDRVGPPRDCRVVTDGRDSRHSLAQCINAPATPWPIANERTSVPSCVGRPPHQQLHGVHVTTRQSVSIHLNPFQSVSHSTRVTTRFIASPSIKIRH